MYIPEIKEPLYSTSYLSFYACSVLGLLVARHLEIKLKKGQAATNECVYRGNVPLCGYPRSIPATAYQTFIFVSDSITKLGRACSSDVYSVLKLK